MASQYDAQLNITTESAYGTFVATSSRSVEYDDESLAAIPDRVMSNGIRAGRMGLGELEGATVPKGAKGTIKLTPQTKGFGIFLKNMLGSSAIGTISSGKYLQTHTVGALYGLSTDIQVYRPYLGGASGATFTYTGCKFPNWSLTGGVDKLVECSLTVDAAAEATGTALTAAAYATGTEPFVWSKTTVTVDGSSFGVSAWDVNMDNALKVDRFHIQTTQKDEPVEDGDKSITGSLSGADFTSLTVYNKIVASTLAGALASIVITCTGQADTAATLTITIPKARLDSGFPATGASSRISEQPIGFTALWPSAGTTPLTVAYNSTDAAY